MPRTVTTTQSDRAAQIGPEPVHTAATVVAVEKPLASYTIWQLLRFVVPSSVGALLFLTPVSIDGHFTVAIALLIDYVNAAIKPVMVPVAVAVATLSGGLTLAVVSSALRHRQNRFVQLFNPGRNWTLVRLFGAMLALMVYFEFGPEWIWHRDTGGVMLYDIAPIVLAFYLLSSVLLPLLTDYGLMEFVGTLVGRLFEKLFGLPGRAAVDSIASWLSASSVGIILTTQQYRAGFYTSRQACTIATNFSVFSIGYSYLLLKLIGMEHVFIEWYGSVAITGVICALIVPRLPPLRNKPERNFSSSSIAPVAERRSAEGLLAFGLRRAVERAELAKPPLEQLKDSFHITLDIALTVYTSMMLIGCVGLALIKYTMVFQLLSLPLVPYLELLQIPQAHEAAPALLAGLVDSIMPSLLGAGIESEITRFVLVGVAVSQIVFLTESAIILIRANIGLTMRDVLAIYLLRVAISLPVLSLMAHFVL